MRSAKEANVDDLLSVLQTLDQLEEGPRFCVEDITRLPPSSPETRGSVMAFMDAIAKMQLEIQCLQNDVATHALMLGEHASAAH